MSWNEIAPFVVAICTIVGFFVTAIRWLVKHYLQELKPNGGSSVKDKIDSFSDRLDRVENKLDTLIQSIINKIA